MRFLRACAGILWGAIAVRAAQEVPIPSAGELALASPVASAVPGGAGEANPALVGGESGWRAGAGSTRPLGLSDLDLRGYWVGKGRKGWMPGWSLRWSHLEAGELYREDLLSADLATGGSQWELGGGWRSGRTSFEAGEADWTQGWAVGFVWRPMERISLGGAWEDRSGLHTRDPRDATPWIYRVGAAFTDTDSLWKTHLGIEKRQADPAGWSLGQALHLGILTLRAGVRMEPWVMSWGAGVRWRGVGLEWTQQGEPRTGWQHIWTVSIDP